MKLFSIIISLFLLQYSLMAQQNIPLYSTIIPNSKANSSIKEKSEMGVDGILRISDVVEPSLMVFLPPKEKANGTAVLICPGGGYRILAAGHEGADVATEFASMGVTAFVLKYRLPDPQLQVTPELAPLQDAQRAIQLIREKSKEFGVDPKKVGIMGFSAGGHLASTVGTKFNQSTIGNKGNIDLRPDFMILIYPVISSDLTIAHAGSFEKLLGKNASQEKLKEFSSEKQITHQTPPAFLVHASDDEGVSSMNSIVFYEALLESKVPAELHIYQKGGHGFGLKNPSTSDGWINRLQSWMKLNNWL